MRAALLACWLLCVPGLGLGQSADPEGADPAPVFHIDGTRLIYDPETAGQEMEEDHLDTLLTLLRDNPEITTLELNSEGGLIWVGDRMAEIVIDFELDTHVLDTCWSSCVTVFLGGTKRTMARGGTIGFHQLWWAAEDIEGLYESERENQNWDTPWDFVESVYADTQTEAYERLSFMMSRGVDPAFAIETLKTPSDDIWTPWRVRLLASGVLTE